MFSDLRSAKWSYHSFAPIKEEQVPFDQLITGYREVTPPGGMENWFEEGFEASGWKTGQSGFTNSENVIVGEDKVLLVNEWERDSIEAVGTTQRGLIAQKTKGVAKAIHFSCCFS